MGAGRIIVQGVQTPVGIRSLALLAASLAWIGLLAGWDSIYLVPALHLASWNFTGGAKG